MLTLSQSGIEFVGFNPSFARGHMEAIRDARGPERIVAFLRFMVRVNEHAEKKVLSVSKMVQIDGNGKQARIGEAIDFIVNNFSDEISIDRAANIAGMSPAAFSRNFQSTTGHKFVEFVNRIRIGQACGMLYATDAQVSTICFDVGFQNLANFNRHFLKMKNMTPTEYRNTAQTDLAPSAGTSR
jgi:AraC-like DNA-binding protein